MPDFRRRLDEALESLATILYGPREPGVPPPSLGDKLFAFGLLLFMLIVMGLLVARRP